MQGCRTVRLFCADVARRRLDRFLADTLLISRSRASFLVRSGAVLVNGKRADVSYRTAAGDTVEATICPPAEMPRLPAQDSVEVIYEDEDIIVINKPPGILTHPVRAVSCDSVVSRVLSRTHLSSVGRPLRPGIVHRLDRDTSGVMLLAKTDRAHWFLVEEFASRRVEKTYLALCEGTLPAGSRRVEFTAAPDPAHRTRMRVRFLRGKACVSDVECLACLTDISLARVRPMTGRTHQVRLTLAYLGCPVLGDEAYGARRGGFSRTALHAESISLRHPSSHQRVAFRARVWEDMRVFIEARFPGLVDSILVPAIIEDIQGTRD